MNEILELLRESATRVLSDAWGDAEARAAGDGWPADLWDQLQQLGLHRALVSEANEGAGLSFGEGLALVRAIGAHPNPVPLPLPETIAAAHLLDQAGMAVPNAPITLGPVAPGDEIAFSPQGDGWTASGALRRVPWGRDAPFIVVAGKMGGGEEEALALVALDGAAVQPGMNLAAEPRDGVALDRAAVVALAPRPGAVEALIAHGAALRAAQIAAACATVLAMTVEYARTREQFGRPIARFQAVQQNLAVMAGAAAAAGGAADLAADAADGRFAMNAAIAKVRAGAAASVVAAMAHQTFAAIGYTDEHALHRLTKRLLSWREEMGAERHWAQLIGREAFARGGDQFWRLVSGA